MKLLNLIFILSLIFTTKFNAQTVDLDSHKLHIGDSFESVKKQFDPKLYKFITDSSSYPIYSYLYKHINQFNFSFKIYISENMPKCKINNRI